MSNLPIVLDRYKICKGRCGNRNTLHRLTVYKDEDIWTCLTPGCGHKETIKYENRAQEEMPFLTKADADRIRRNLMSVVGDLQTHKWGTNIGKKDRSFISRTVARLIGIGKDLDK